MAAQPGNKNTVAQLKNMYVGRPAALSGVARWLSWAAAAAATPPAPPACPATAPPPLSALTHVFACCCCPPRHPTCSKVAVGCVDHPDALVRTDYSSGDMVRPLHALGARACCADVGGRCMLLE